MPRRSSTSSRDFPVELYQPATEFVRMSRWRSIEMRQRRWRRGTASLPRCSTCSPARSPTPSFAAHLVARALRSGLLHRGRRREPKGKLRRVARRRGPSRAVPVRRPVGNSRCRSVLERGDVQRRRAAARAGGRREGSDRGWTAVSSQGTQGSRTDSDLMIGRNGGAATCRSSRTLTGRDRALLRILAPGPGEVSRALPRRIPAPKDHDRARFGHSLAIPTPRTLTGRDSGIPGVFPRPTQPSTPPPRDPVQPPSRHRRRRRSAQTRDLHRTAVDHPDPPSHDTINGGDHPLASGRRADQLRACRRRDVGGVDRSGIATDMAPARRW